MTQHEELHFGRFRLHPVQGLFCGTACIAVTPKSLSVLLVLATHAGQLVTKEELFRRVWGNSIVSDAALTSCIQELRRVLGDDARAPRYIQTHHRRGFRFIGCERDASARKSAALTRFPTRAPAKPLFGRDTAIENLARAWAAACDGTRQIVFVTGEAGIGKTTLVEHFLAGVPTQEAQVCVTACIERFDVLEAYQPLLEALPRLCSGPDRGRRIAMLRRCAPTWLAQLQVLQNAGESAALQRQTSGSTPERMLRELTDALEALSRMRPIILCIEDLHWCDTPTLDWIASFAYRPEAAAVLILCTVRTGESSPGARITQSILDTLRLRGVGSEIALPRLDEQAVRDYVELILTLDSGATPAAAKIARWVYRHSEGNPLFITNILADLITRGDSGEREARWTKLAGMRDLGIPENIRLTIEQQVARLAPAERHLLEVASVANTTCTAAVIAAAANRTVAEVESVLAPLARRHAFLREVQPEELPDGTLSASFEFLHSLYREVLYARISAGQRAEIHRSVGIRLEAAFGARAPHIASELAMHFERARELPRAIHYLHHAAANDASRSAHESAQQHYRHALALIENLPPSADRDRIEAGSRIGLGSVLTQLRGWGAVEVEHEYSRALHLCERHGEQDLSFSACWNLWIGSIARGRIEDAHVRSQAVFDLACCSASSSVRMQGHHALWTTAFARGDFQQVPVHVCAGIDLYEPGTQHLQAYGSHDACVCAHVFQARTAAISGQPIAATRAIECAITLARRLGHPFTLSFALMHASAVRLEIGEPAAALQCATEASGIAEEQEFSLMRAWANCFRGAAIADMGRFPEGIDFLAAGIEKARSTGSDMFLPHFRSLIAHAQIRCARFADARQNIDDGLALADRNGERTYLAELHRLRGQLALVSAAQRNPDIDARHELRLALSTAREQGARSLALKAALDLSTILTREGETAEANTVIEELAREY